MPETIRRVVTGHDATGKAIVLMDGAASKVNVRKTTGGASTLLWVTDTTPADMSGNADAAERQVAITPPLTGSIFRTVEFPPEKDYLSKFSGEEMMAEMGVGHSGKAGEKPRHPGMHRTDSIDYAVVISGEVDMLLDDSEVHLKAGDVVVQQGTNHAWANRGDAPCLIAFVLIGGNR